MKLCCGPLPDGHPKAGVTYFCVDQDVAAQACNLRVTPVLSKFEFTTQEAVLLDAHRAPDEWWECAQRMPFLLVQGDALAYRPRSCNKFACELEACAAVQTSPAVNVHVQVAATISDSLSFARGRSIILAGSRATRDTIFEFLRPQGLQAGDGIMDLYGRYATIHSLNTMHVNVDGGRRVLRRAVVTQHVVVSPSNLRGSEYDTVIVMPDVAFAVARAACRRTRYMIVGIGHSPFGYLGVNNTT